MQRQRPVVIPAEAGSPEFHPFGSPYAATWRPLGDMTLTFNHHLEGQRLVLSPGSTTTSRISWLRHLPVRAAPAACGRVGAEPGRPTPNLCSGSTENSDSIEWPKSPIYNSTYPTPPPPPAPPRMPCWPPFRGLTVSRLAPRRGKKQAKRNLPQLMTAARHQLRRAMPVSVLSRLPASQLWDWTPPPRLP